VSQAGESNRCLAALRLSKRNCFANRYARLLF
jgi:hypothetical protein